MRTSGGHSSQISQKHLRWISFFVNCRALRRGGSRAAITSKVELFVCKYIYMNIFFPVCFFSEKTKAATGYVLWKKVFLKIEQYFTRKHLCWSLFLIKLQVFKNTYFEKHLWTTACKNINICLKFFYFVEYTNVNKEKKHVRKFNVRSHVTQEL